MEEDDDEYFYMYQQAVPEPVVTEPQKKGVGLLAGGEFGRVGAYRPPTGDGDPRMKGLIRKPSTRPRVHGSHDSDLISVCFLYPLVTPRGPHQLLVRLGHGSQYQWHDGRFI